MNKILKWTLIVLASIAVLLFIAYQGLMMHTKSFSPQQTSTLSDGSVEVSVTYSGPSKNNRKVFGELVPFGDVWRTGANEATVFKTNSDLTIDGKTLPKGEYTLFTIPDAGSWQVIFNGKAYDWGINFDGTSIREASADVLTIKVPTESLSGTQEVFDISLVKNVGMTLSWDQTKVTVPLSY